jgi:hypothetical protein
MNEAFAVYKLNEQGMALATNIGQDFNKLLETLKAYGVKDRYLALVTTELEKACFFAKKSIAVNPTYHAR